MRVVQEETGIVLLSEEIFFHNNTVFIKASPTTKNKLFIKKQQIVSKTKERIGDKTFFDIR